VSTSYNQQIEELQRQLQERLDAESLSALLLDVQQSEADAVTALAERYALEYAHREAELLSGNECPKLVLSKGVTCAHKVAYVVADCDTVPDAFKTVDLKLVKQGLAEGLELTDIQGIEAKITFVFTCK
jgi:hypothetical protein